MAKYQTVQEKDGDWVGPQYSVVRGVRIAPFLLDTNFGKDHERFQTRKVVFVASYPKSGGSLNLQQNVECLINRVLL